MARTPAPAPAPSSSYVCREIWPTHTCKTSVSAMPAPATTARPSTPSLSSCARPDAPTGNIYREKVTGARADRRELLRMLDRLGPGDVVTVTRIEGLARSTFDLVGIVNQKSFVPDLARTVCQSKRIRRSFCRLSRFSNCLCTLPLASNMWPPTRL
jgi:hypothetical protein